MDPAMEPKISSVLDDETIDNELEQIQERHPDYKFDTSFAADESFAFDNTDSEYTFNFNPDETDTWSPEPVPEVEAMRVACASGDLTSVQTVYKTYWLDKPADKRINKDNFGASGLCEAIKRDDIAIGSYLLSNVVSMHEVHFAMATEHRSYSFLQLCIDRGWNINLHLSRWTPPALSLAVEDERLTRWFLSNGADPNAVCGLDITPLSIAVRDAPFSIIKLLFDHGGSIEHGQLLHFATSRASLDRLEVFEYILNKGASVNAIMFQNCLESYEQEKYSGLGTPLHSAAEKGNLDMVQILLAKGADPLIKDSTGQLAIGLARYYGHDKVVEYLRPLSVPSSEPHYNFTDGRRVGTD